jgi:23S rRNA (uracil1939-C5)-methyltransferase
MEREVEIARLGAQGDGVAEGFDSPLYVPFALPGERVRVAVALGDDRAELLAVLRPSPDRVEPVCRHFGVCGGCALQHLDGAAYLDRKREKVVAALRSRGLDAEVEPVCPVPLGSRRRAALALARGKDGMALGCRRARSHELIDVAVCPVETALEVLDEAWRKTQGLKPVKTFRGDLFRTPLSAKELGRLRCARVRPAADRRRPKPRCLRSRMWRGS